MAAADWTRSGSKPELCIQPPRRLRLCAIGSDEFTNSELRSIAIAQRVLLFALLAEALVYAEVILLLGILMPPRLDPSTVNDMTVPAMAFGFLVLLGQLVAIARLLIAMKIGFWIFVVAPLAMIPCMQLVVLVIVNQVATGTLQRAGVKVGFMGADSNAIPYDDSSE